MTALASRPTSAPTPPPRRGAGHALAPLAVALLAAVAAAVTYRVFLRTPLGQQVDTAAMRGGDVDHPRVVEVLSRTLNGTTLASLVLVCLARGRRRHAAQTPRPRARRRPAGGGRQRQRPAAEDPAGPAQPRRLPGTQLVPQRPHGGRRVGGVRADPGAARRRTRDGRADRRRLRHGDRGGHGVGRVAPPERHGRRAAGRARLGGAGRLRCGCAGCGCPAPPNAPADWPRSCCCWPARSPASPARSAWPPWSCPSGCHPTWSPAASRSSPAAPASPPPSPAISALGAPRRRRPRTRRGDLRLVRPREAPSDDPVRPPHR